MANNRGKVSPMTPVTLKIYIITIIALGLFFFFIRGDIAGKLCACTACPAMIIYLIYAYRKEKRADENAVAKNQHIVDGSYFESPVWHEKYILYKNEHPFERPTCSNMKKDLLLRVKRKEYFVGMLVMLFLMFCACCLMVQQLFMGILGFLLFGVLFYWKFSLFIGMPVRKWLKGDIDYAALETSYKNARFLTYKKNGFAFGLTHIHAYTENKVYAIDYRLVEGISRKIVRLKKYEDNIFSSEEYQHFAVIHVRLPQSGKLQNVEIELNEFQVQMAIDYLQIFKFGEDLTEDINLEQKEDNEVV